ncbi:MAG: TatD family nuclease-associated radical SAM protein [Firmicutes bacterium]|nr:TatD family nuclease-associated radical SAM protein [Bacillota bacterium]
MGNTYLYEYGGSLYINLTSKCSNDCIFCLRNGTDGVGGETLWLDREPEAGEVIAALSACDLAAYKETVFCGFGEPTYRMDALVEIGRFLRGAGKYVRLDTNGQGCLINGYDITPCLSGAVDFVSVSLNNANTAAYNKNCNSIYANAYEQLLEFAKKCKEQGIRVQFSVVDIIPPDEIERCREIAKKMGAEFKLRSLWR